MEKNNLAVRSFVSAMVACVFGIPGIYLFYDFYYRSSDGVIMRHVALRPYGVLLGSCPSILFWFASVIAVWTGSIALRQTRNLASSKRDRSLASIAIILGGIGTFAGLIVTLYIIFLLFLYFATYS